MNEQNSLPVTFVIFGASGDLVHRKLIPSLFNLCRKNRLPDFRIVGFAINDWNDEQFRKSLREGVDKFGGYKYTKEEWADFSSKLTYMKGNFTNPEDFEKLKAKLQSIEKGP